jgi:nanoRNase/pAp phosphatase (c-di-AMP/oligoRNAs hydrolase)
MKNEKFRLVTRSDFDGLVCAVLLKKVGIIEDIMFVHPKDMQDGKVAVSARDITTNLPYVEGVHLAFDHHLSETIRNKGERRNHIIDPTAFASGTSRTRPCRGLRQIHYRRSPLSMNLTRRFCRQNPQFASC